MKLHIFIAALVATFMPRLCGASLTANTTSEKGEKTEKSDSKTDDTATRLAALEARLAEQQQNHERQIASMQDTHNRAIGEAGQAIEAALAGKLSVATAPLEEADTSMLGLLCKGAGVDIKDVRWRVAAGLLPEQAVQAAVDQKANDAKKVAEAKKADAEKKK